MNKKTYMKKFSRVVRWRLQKSEADEVLNDYEEMLLNHAEYDNDSLIQELGEPLQAVRLLTEPKAYHLWLSVFSVMAFCLLLPEIMLLWAPFSWKPWYWLPELLLVGIFTSLVWFRPCRKGIRCPLPNGFISIAATLLLGALAGGGVIWSPTIGAWEWIPFGMYGSAAKWTLWIVGSVGAMAGLWGLVQARMSDFRWRALYVMGLTILIECTIIISLLTSMDPHSANWCIPYTATFSITGILGIAAVGVSLC